MKQKEMNKFFLNEIEPYVQLRLREQLDKINRRICEEHKYKQYWREKALRIINEFRVKTRK